MKEVEVVRTDLNIGNSIFKGFNDEHGIVLCGYEWGCAKDSNCADVPTELSKPPVTFANKVPVHGPDAKTWPYDNRIIKWFSIWGHPLNEDGLGADFDKCIVQTNWCDTQAHHIDEDYGTKLLRRESIDNFIEHMAALRPRIIIFFGIKQLDFLQHSSVLPKFEAIFGEKQEQPQVMTKPFSGKQFRVGFQRFGNTTVAAFPHPSGSQGLSNEYISLFKEEMNSVLSDFKKSRSIS